jgi:hypothetical protein
LIFVFKRKFVFFYFAFVEPIFADPKQSTTHKYSVIGELTSAVEAADQNKTGKNFEKKFESYTKSP